MNNKGSVLLIVVGVVMALVVVAGALLLTGRAPAGPGAAAPAGFGLGFSASYARTPGGVTATLTVTNKRTQAVDDVRLVLAELASMTGTRALPLALGTVPAGGTVSVTLPYTGPAPAANAPLQLQLHYDFKAGFFSRGGGTSSVIGFVP